MINDHAWQSLFCRQLFVRPSTSELESHEPEFTIMCLNDFEAIPEIDEIPEAIRSSLRKKVKVNDVDRYLNLFDAHSFDFDILGFELDYHNHFHYGGLLIDTEFTEEQVKQFIKKYESIFDILADRYIKKIHCFEK